MRARRVGLEALERRQLMAGDVSAAIVNGTLVIKSPTGDTQPNWIQVTEVAGNQKAFRIQGKAFDGAFTASGTPVAGTTPTTINGSTRPVTLVTTNDRIQISLLGGNDAVSYGSSLAPSTTAGLSINTGAGRDYVRVQRMQLVGNNATLTVNTGSDTQADNELVQLTKVGTPLDLAAGSQHINIALGGGNDKLYMDNTRVGGNTTINLGAGADTVFAKWIDLNVLSLDAGTSNHRDVIKLGDPNAGGFDIDVRITSATVLLGAGNDLIDIVAGVGIYVEGDLLIDGGAGAFDELRGGDSVYAPMFNKATDLLGVEITDLP